MSRPRSFRRAQLAKAKLRARHLYVRVWRVREHHFMESSSRYIMQRRVAEPTDRWIGHMASTHCRPCSCIGCQAFLELFPKRHQLELEEALEESVEVYPDMGRR